MTVYDLVDCMVDASQQMVRLYDANDDFKIVYDGFADSIPDEYDDADISSIDVVEKGSDGFIGLNITKDGD